MFDRDFLEEQIELNESIELLKADKEQIDKVSMLTNDLSSKMEQLVESINSYLSQTEYEMAWKSLAKYKFYRNHLIELEPMIKQ